MKGKGVARYIERTKYDWWGTIWRFAVFVGLISFAIIVIYPWRGLALTLMMVVLSLWLYTRLMSGRLGYRCAKCGKVFQVPTLVNFLSLSTVGKNRDGTYYSAKNLTCPYCGKLTKARLVKRADARTAGGAGRMLK